MSEMIERVASAIWAARQEVHGQWPDDGPYEDQPAQVRDWVRAEARAAIAAMREPAEEQFDQVSDTGRMWRDLTSREVYQAMIDGALK